MKKNPSKLKPDVLKPKAVYRKRSIRSKNKKNVSEPKPDTLKPKALT